MMGILRRRTPSPLPPLYLVSTAGHPNYGDEYIARAWLRLLARVHPERTVWLDCPNPGRASVLLRDDHPRLRVTDTLWQLARMSPSADPAEQSRAVADRLRDLGTPRVDAGLVMLRDMPAVHLLGGGYVNAIWPENFALVAALSTLAREHGTRVIVTGQGLLPADSAFVDHYAPRLAEFAHADVRDAGSAQAFSLEHGLDDAFLGLREMGPPAPQEDAPDLMVLVQWDFAGGEGSDDSLGRTIDAFLTAHGGYDGASVGFAEALPPDDGRLVAAVRERLPSARFYPFLELWDRGLPVRTGQLWLTSRFHFHLLAAAGGAQGYVLNVKPGYYDHKHGSLAALGTGWAEVPLGAEQFPGLPEADFAAAAVGLAQQKAAVADSLYRNV